jgi:hypothetical protein
VTTGPLTGDNELVAGFAMIKVRSMDHAVELARRFAGLADVEIEIGPVVEAWDLGYVPKPTNLESERFLLLFKADAAFEKGIGPGVAALAEMARLVEELKAAGVLLTIEGLAPSAQGKRLASGPKGKRTWVDGPFSESKELIAGFSILNVPSLTDAVAWANRYAAILGDNEVDVRVVLNAAP